MKFKAFCVRYSCMAGLSVIVTNMLAFYATHLLMFGRKYGDGVILSIDRKLPFVPEFIIVYVLAFVQWVACYLVLMIEDKGKAYRYATAASVANLVCGVIFVIFPTAMTIRPDPSGSGLVGFLVRFIFAADTPPVNLFPSIHCLESWMCIRMLFVSKKTPAALKWLNLVFSLAVFAAVALVKQHAVVDIPAGILVAEAGLLAVKRFKWDEKLIKLEAKLFS